MQQGLNLVDPSGALSPDIVMAARSTNACLSVSMDEIKQHKGVTFNVKTEKFDAQNGAWGAAGYPLQQLVARQPQSPSTMCWNYNISSKVTGMHGKPYTMCNGTLHNGKWISPGNCDTDTQALVYRYTLQHVTRPCVTCKHGDT